VDFGGAQGNACVRQQLVKGKGHGTNLIPPGLGGDQRFFGGFGYGDAVIAAEEIHPAQLSRREGGGHSRHNNDRRDQYSP